MKRRHLIQSIAALVPLAAHRNLLAQELPPTAGTCRLISQDIIGPFALEKPPMRAELAEHLSGTPLQLKFQVQNAFSCEPLPGALVSVWHSNAEGLYSGVKNPILGADMAPTGEIVDYTSQNWLRGMQKSDASGQVVFNTIVPGWYFPRPTHIHVQVFPPNFGEVATTQLYLHDSDCDKIYQDPAYAERGPNPGRTDPNADSPTDGTDEGDLWLTMKPLDKGYTASHTLGVVYYGGAFGELPDIYRQG